MYLDLLATNKTQEPETKKETKEDTHHGMVAAEIVSKVKLALQKKPLYQLSALVGDLEYDKENPELIKNPIVLKAIEALKADGHETGFHLTGAGKKSYFIKAPVRSGVETHAENKKAKFIEAENANSIKSVIPATETLGTNPVEASDMHDHNHNGTGFISAVGTADKMPGLIKKAGDQGLEILPPGASVSLPAEKSKKTTKKTTKEEFAKEFSKEDAKATEEQKSKDEQERLKVVESFKETHKYLDTIDQVLQQEWDDNPHSMSKYVSKISTIYAHLQSLKVDAETAYRKRAYTFFQTKNDGLKQYEYKDALAYHCSAEEDLRGRIENQLKTISKHIEVLITLISLAKTELSLGLKNPGQQT